MQLARPVKLNSDLTEPVLFVSFPHPVSVQEAEPKAFTQSSIPGSFTFLHF